MQKGIVLFTIVLVLASVCSAELICDWSFDGNIDNSVENSPLNAVPYGEVKYCEGLSGRALNLAGSDTALIVNNSEIFNNLNAFSICFWAKLDTGSPNILAAFVSKNGEENQGWQVRTYKNYGFASFLLRGPECQKNDCFGGLRVDDGNWHHIAAVYEGRFASIYVDGKLADIDDAPAKGIGSTDSPLVIGAKIARGKKEPYCFLKGALDSLKIYDNALNFNQVKKLADRDILVNAKLTQIYQDHDIYPVPIHRGGGRYQPENTIEAFEYSWSRNLVPEGDIRTTKDDVIVCFHDNDLNRTAPSAPDELKNRPIGELTLADLKSVDVGEFRGKPGQKIPTLDEVFEVMSRDPGKCMYLDYKTIDLNRLVEMTQKHNIEKQVIFTTKNYDLICRWRELLPESQTMIWMGSSEQAISRKLDYLRQYDFKNIYIVHLHYKPIENGYQLSDEFMLGTQAELQKRGIILQIMPWDIDDPAVYERLFQIGILNVGTDYPDVLLPVFKKYW